MPYYAARHTLSRAALPFVAVAAVILAGLLPGIHAVVGCPLAHQHERQSQHPDHASKPQQPLADRADPAAPPVDDDDDDDCPICLLIASSQHIGSGLVLLGPTLVAVAPAIETPRPHVLIVRSVHRHRPCITRGPPPLS